MKKVAILVGVVAIVIYTATQVSPLKNVRPAWIIPGKVEPSADQESLSAGKVYGQEITVNGKNYQLTLPEGFSISVFTQGLGKPRFMAIDSSGVLHVSIPSQGKVVALPDSNSDSVADRQITVASNLQYPHGLAFHKGYLYIALENAILKVKDINGDFISDEEETLVANLPFGGGKSTGRGHRTRTIGFDRQDNMYLSVGSSCNACIEEGRGVIMRFKDDGSNPEIFAKGIRNAVGFVLHPDTDEIWATENTRDLLGDNFPPDEVMIVSKDKHYGWPYCNGDQIPDPDFGEGREEFCQSTEPPHISLQAHSAPLGLRFIGDKLYIAYHGSWNRSIPTGYKIVQIDPETKEVSDWIDGWLVNGKSWGRPVDIIENNKGDIFISDDQTGVIYRVSRIQEN